MLRPPLLDLDEQALCERLRTMGPARLLRLARIIAGTPEKRVILARFAAGAERFATSKKPISHDLAGGLAALPAGQRRVAEALVAGDDVPTYPELAERLGLGLGTVQRHLKRIREGRPETYAALMAERRRQLAMRHGQAVERREERSRRWHRKQANRRYREWFGRYPWEPRPWA
jgi:hypothetical protein